MAQMTFQSTPLWCSQRKPLSSANGSLSSAALRTDYKPSEAILSQKPLYNHKAPFDEPRGNMQGNRVGPQRDWVRQNLIPITPATVLESGGLSKTAPRKLTKWKQVPTDEGPLRVPTISDTVDRIPSVDYIHQLIQLDSRKLTHQPTLDDK